MKDKKIINCDVCSCMFNDKKDCKCNLNEIKVSTTSSSKKCKDKKYTICDSYIDEKENESK